MDKCKIGGQTNGSNFEELMEVMSGDLYWIRFFARPCCPAPDLEGAVSMLDRLAGEVDSREDFSADEKQALHDVIEAREEWYPSSGLCRTKRS